MSHIVAVHGIANEFFNADVILSKWRPCITGSLKLIEWDSAVEIDLAFYGDLFRRKGTMGSNFPPRDLDDLSEYEGELLVQFWKAAATMDPSVIKPEAQTMMSGRDLARRALNAISSIPLMARAIDERATLWLINQVYRYFNEPAVRAAARRRVENAIRPDTRVVVAHSLGSVVAYEALCAHPEWNVRSFVSLGSPLGIRTHVFDRLRPAPGTPYGCWPGAVTQWTNVSATRDFVALQPRLATAFGPRVADVAVDNGRHPHDAERYLTAVEVSRAIRGGLGAD